MYAQINGNETFYDIHGQGRPMLLMHGGPGLDHTHFRPWLDSLSEQVQLIYYDQFGMGRSSRPLSFEGVTHETWVDEADALRSALGHDRMILFGFSYGGFLAQEYALRYANHLDGLILCDTAPVLDYPDVIVANAQASGTPEQVQAVVGGLSNPAAFADDAAFRQVFSRSVRMGKRILPNVVIRRKEGLSWQLAKYRAKTLLLISIQGCTYIKTIH